jgi:hypothetical protein
LALNRSSITLDEYRYRLQSVAFRLVGVGHTLSSLQVLAEDKYIDPPPRPAPLWEDDSESDEEDLPEPEWTSEEEALGESSEESEEEETRKNRRTEG